jgi:hypothetical protein
MRLTPNRVQQMRLCDKRDFGGARIVPGAQRVGDSNTEWWWQGVLCGAHNLLDCDVEQHGAGQTSVLSK